MAECSSGCRARQRWQKLLNLSSWSSQPSSQAPCSLLWQKALSTLLLLFHTCEGPFCSSCHCPGPRDRVAVGPGSHHKEIPVGHLPSAFRGPGPKWPPGGAEAPGVGHLPVLCELPPLEDRAAADQDGGGPLPLPRWVGAGPGSPEQGAGQHPSALSHQGCAWRRRCVS